MSLRSVIIILIMHKTKTLAHKSAKQRLDVSPQSVNSYYHLSMNDGLSVLQLVHDDHETLHIKR